MSRTEAGFGRFFTGRRLVVRLLAIGLLAGLAGGCRQDMHDQPRYDPLEESKFFADRQASRPLLEGTIARGHLRDDLLLYTGRRPGAARQTTESVQVGQGFADLFPFPVTPEILDRGQDRYDIFCSVCHDRAGYGDGMIVRRGYRRPPSLHEDRLREAPAGYFFDVITNGFGSMPNYAAQISPRDRWAIVAYLRALQVSQNSRLDDVPPDRRMELESGRQ